MCETPPVSPCSTLGPRPGLRPGLGRRAVLQTGLAGMAVVGVSRVTTGPAWAAGDDNYLVGRGMSDITGPAADLGMMGYSMPQQTTAGIHQRLWARAFVVVDPASGNRVAWCLVDQAILPMAVHSAVLTRLAERHGSTYHLGNVSLTATHTHAAPGGCSHYLAYNLSIMGFQQQNFDAFVDGVVEAISAAHTDLRPGSILVGRGMLRNASVNRSRGAFDLNPTRDRDHYPDAIDPAMTVLRLRQGRTDVGAISWFPTHGTSLPNTNRLISPDNKGYAGYHWEHDVRGVRYHRAQPSFVAAFAQTNAGDMSPNLALEPGTGPTDDPFENTRIIGQRQSRKAQQIFDAARTRVVGRIDARCRYVDMSQVQVSGRFTPDGQRHHTSPGVIGASMVAGSTEDGPGLPVPEGMDDPLYPLWQQLNAEVPPELANEQAPKTPLVASGPVGGTPHVLPLQVIKLGQLVIVGGPAEFTIVSGLRIRRSVAEALGMPLNNVVMQGYTNGFSQYCTTPEEYDAQNYEGASTLFGRYTLPAYQQEFTALAAAIHTGAEVEDPGPAAPPATATLSITRPPVVDSPGPGREFGHVLSQPEPAYIGGETVSVDFVSAHPKNDLRRNGTYLEVQRRVDGRWRRHLDDNDWVTRFHWAATNPLTGESTATITWEVGRNTPRGRYRIVHRGAARDASGRVTPFEGATRALKVG